MQAVQSLLILRELCQVAFAFWTLAPLLEWPIRDLLKCGALLHVCIEHNQSSLWQMTEKPSSPFQTLHHIALGARRFVCLQQTMQRSAFTANCKLCSKDYFQFYYMSWDSLTPCIIINMGRRKASKCKWLECIGPADFCVLFPPGKYYKTVFLPKNDGTTKSRTGCRQTKVTKRHMISVCCSVLLATTKVSIHLGWKC